MQCQYPVETQTLVGTWKTIAEHHRESFPNLILLATLAIIHPVHTADCERAFSSQNVITTSLKNRINSHHCNEQMKIMIMGAESDNLISLWTENEIRWHFWKYLRTPQLLEDYNIYQGIEVC